MRKMYYRLSFHQTSPLRISNGGGELTDSDLMKDKRGMPFIPGTSIAGVLRSMLADETAGRLFGELDAPCPLIVSDACLSRELSPDDILITQRDGVGLNDNGTAIPSAKYDFETVELPEGDHPYVALLEWSGDSEPPAELTALLARLVSEGVCFGARTSRGYGDMRVEVRQKRFDFPKMLDEWLAFDPLAAPAEVFEPFETLPSQNAGRDWLLIEARFEVVDSISVRVYSSSAQATPGDGVPRYEPLSNARGEAVVPGTSWAGCFRHHMRNLARQLNLGQGAPEEIDTLFGVRGSRNQRQKQSGIWFSESAIRGGSNYRITRNAIDRFTGAPRNTGLYTAQVCRGGSGTLRLRVHRQELTPLTRQLLGAALLDLHLGLLTVGGEGNVGRGRVRLTELLVDGVNRSDRLCGEEADCDEFLGEV